MQNHLSFNEIIPFFISAVTALGTDSKDIKRQPDDIFCKCPVCGDSRYGNKKRLHLYQKGEVINVNCFNGECQVKNYTPYRFFQEFHPRTFNEFRNFYRKRFLLEIQDNLEVSKKEEKLEVIQASEADIFSVTEAPRVSKKEEILSLVTAFEFSGDDNLDLENFKKFVQAVRALGDGAFEEFREMMR